LAAAILFASGCLIGLVATVALLAAAGLWLVARGAGHGRWITLALLAAFTILTPLYHPYARLLLPALVAAMLVAGVTTAMLAVRLASARPVRSRAGVRALAAAIAGLALLVGLRREALTTYRSSRGMAIAAERIAQLVPRNAEVVVLGEPAIVFYLRARRFRAWHYDRPSGLMDGRYSAGDTIYVAGGIYSRRARGLERIAGQFAGAIDSLGTIPLTEVNHVRLLDDFSPARARSFLRSELTAPTDRYHLEVFRVVVPDSAANSSR
jgi:hypothetical protein